MGGSQCSDRGMRCDLDLNTQCMSARRTDWQVAGQWQPSVVWFLSATSMPSHSAIMLHP